MHGNSKAVLFFACVFVVFGCGRASEDSSPSDSARPKKAASKEEPIFVDADAGRKWNVFGLEIIGKIMSDETNGRYSVVVSTTPPEGGPPIHVHDNEDELFYVIDGEYEFRCGEKRVRVSKGALVHLPRKLPHSFRNIGEHPGVLMNTITPGGFEQFFAEIDQLSKDVPPDRKKVQAIASKYGLAFLAETN